MMTNLKFLDFWFQGAEGYIEVRLIGKEGVKDRYFIAVNDLNEDLIQQINKQAYGEKLNVFFGVATRKQYGKGTEEDIQDVPGLWVDIDPKHASMSDAIQTVSQLPTPPTAIVSSGNGIHAYLPVSRRTDGRGGRHVGRISSALSGSERNSLHGMGILSRPADSAVDGPGEGAVCGHGVKRLPWRVSFRAAKQ